MPTTKIVLPIYQNNLWVISKREKPETSIKDKMKILKILRTNKDKKEKIKTPILFFIFIPGVAKFKIKRR